MKRVTRRTPLGGLQLRSAGDGSEGIFEALVMNYNVVDEYNTMFTPGVFTKSLKRRMPRVCWSHDWAEPIGRVTSYDDNEKDLRVTCQLDDFDAVPMARRAWVQMDSGTIDQFSVGFMAQKYEMPSADGGAVRFTLAQLDEISPVLVGAVPKTKLLSTRSLLRIATPDGAEPMVPFSILADVFGRIMVGEIDVIEAGVILKAAAVVPDEDPEPEPKPDEDPPEDPPELSDAELEAQAKVIELEDLASIDDALSLVGM